MKVIHLHIDNFGTLQNTDLDFTDGKNSFLKDNGWGKTTLAAFLRVMFFGFDNETKKVKDREKTKYIPWNGGTYGGEILFECNGKQYLLSRSFNGQKNEFSLKDAVTLLDSTDYTENIGEEIFGVDRESFKRTSFINQKNLFYQGSNSTISSKVGDITELDDLGNYDGVEVIIKNYLLKKSPERATGELKKQKQNIKDLENEVHKKDVLIKTAEVKRAEIEKANAKTEELKNRQKELLKKQNTILGRQAKANDVKRYRELLNEAEVRRETVNSKRNLFGEKIPSLEKLEELGKANEEAKILSDKIKEANDHTGEERFERLERYFKANPPKEEEIDQKLELCEEIKKAEDGRKKADEEEETARAAIRSIKENVSAKEDEISEKEKELKALTESMAEMPEATDAPVEEEITDTKAEEDSAGEDSGLSADYKKHGTLSKTLTVLSAILLATGFILLLLFVLLHLNNPVLIGAGILLLLGLVLLIVSMTENSKAKHAKLLEEEKKRFREEKRRQKEEEIKIRQARLMERMKQQEEMLRMHEKMQKQCQDALQSLHAEIESLNEKKAGLEAKIELCEGSRNDLAEKGKNIKNELKEFFDRYELSYGSDAAEVLYEMKGFLREYKELLKVKAEKDLRDENNKKVYSEKCESLLCAAEELGIEKNNDAGISHEELRRKIQSLTDLLQELEIAEKELKDAEDKCGKYLEDHPEIKDEAQDEDSLKTASDFEAESVLLGEKIHEISDQIPEQIKNNRKMENDLDEILDEIRVLNEKEEQIKDLQEDYDARMKQYAIIQKTGEYLKDAKEHFVANFTRPLKDAFERYYSIMVGMTEFQNSDFRIDANLDLTRKEEGAYHDISMQSDGYADMIGMCMRLALLDVMYKGEKPVIIMDDPFLNLDGNHLSGAKAFLDRVATEYQILYFTCHDSRL